MVGSAITEIGAPPAVPVVGDTLSQLPPVLVLATAPNDTEELGEVVTDRFCDSREVEFTELKVNEAGAGTKLNGGGMTVRVTATHGVLELEELEAAV